MSECTVASNSVNEPKFQQRRVRYNNGFIRVESGLFTSSYEYAFGGDPEINRLMEYWRKLDTLKNTWDFHKDIILQGARLIPNLISFVDANRNNDEVCDKNFFYLQTILDYVATGQQSLSPENAKAILEARNPYGHKNTTTRHCMIPDCIRFAQSQHKTDHISQWVSHPGGIINLLLTLDVLFGREHSQDYYY